MNDYVKVAKLHLVDRLSYTMLPLTVLVFTFAVNVAIFAVLPPEASRNTGALFALPCFMIVLGVMTLTRSLPFALSLGITRRTYYLGSVGLAVASSAVWAVAITVLNLIEGAVSGWGIGLHFFRVPWALDGPWYQVVVTSTVVLAVFFMAGMWGGLIYRRWGVVGLLAAIAALVLLILAGVLLASWRDAWPRIGQYLAGLHVYSVTGLLAGLTALLGLGGFITIRRIAV